MIACAHEHGQRKRKCLQAASMDDAAATHSCTSHGPQTLSLVHMIHFGEKVFCQSGMLTSTTTRKV